MLQPLDRDRLREEYLEASPFPFIKIDNFLDPKAAAEIAAAYPSFTTAAAQGIAFSAVNEFKKVQITDQALFPAPVAGLNKALASPSFLADLSYVTGIDDLLADELLLGGGMHVTGPGGRLDVHVDFNYIEERQLNRRLNLLLYLNPQWEEDWGGHIQLWDCSVQHCKQAFAPVFNRCVIFETSDHSFHGVTPVSPKAPASRISFAAYYYTYESQPEKMLSAAHSTIFKARPDEPMRKYILMPAEKLRRQLSSTVHTAKQEIKRLIKSAP